MEKVPQQKIPTPLNTACWALGFLFFIQLFTVYVESIYRISLTRLAMGWEMLGVLFLLAPLLLVVIGGRAQFVIVRVAIVGVFVTRIVATEADARVQIVNAGFGVACFLVLLCVAMTHNAPLARPDWGRAIILAVIASIVVRSAEWATYDVSMTSGSAGIDVIVSIAILVGAWRYSRNARTCIPGDAGTKSVATSPVGVIASSLLFFSSVSLIYLVVSSPGVTSAWSGASYTVAVGIVVVSWCATLYVGRRPSKMALLFSNVLFLVLLLGSIVANTTAFPSSADAGPTVVGLDRWWQHVPVYAMLLTSSVLAQNIALALGACHARSLRISAAAVFLGSVMLMVITVMLVFTNVWGYASLPAISLRNRFYYPFAVAGAIALLGIALIKPKNAGADDTNAEGRSWSVWAGTLLTALFLIGFGGARASLVFQADGNVNPTQLCVMTYNMQQGSELGGNQRYLGQLNVIKNINPDVLFLQESDTPRPSGGNVDSVRMYAEALGYHFYYGPKTVTGTFGTAILSRFPLENPRTIFTYSDSDEVGTAVAGIDVAGRRIGLFCNHPSGARDVKFAHVNALVAEASKYDYAIAGGDFNFEQRSPYYAVVAAVLRDSWLTMRPTGVGDAASITGGDISNPNRFDMADRIDHIFTTQNFVVTEARYILAPDSMTDHPAHWCTLKILSGKSV